MTDLFTEEHPIFILASKTKRFFALVIDYIIYFIVFFFIAQSYGEKYVSEDGAVGYHVNGIPALMYMLFWFIIIPILEGLIGQTLGKMIFNIKVLKQDETKISVGNAIVRHLFDIIDYLPFLGIVGLIVSSKNNLRQRVGDLVAKTIVIQK
jgi:uncharacterized RDD family membrane protein YckC